ncbi:tRNA (adenosine(37)-N6)-dimethylallyltransferase MiaA [Loktanella sp. M215]|uniref:tRNA (adenosine(37)-N6)-dimethylallyltransferase MiaA n=1 Tax=Loktanella sp. M215 TaxID=2675431 RepID=UPI001F0044A5|nr:tRNA (adenosine(37)-N6)-dimethylallyltransferase MiaA [Loktanella sp. M215]MCF7700201.1 tRNA (adenosine(37)-N6)-dimethylallyltransferase MiaA [Loktanella sp. M215]
MQKVPMPPSLSPDTPVLIAGPTASGKSALAVAIARTQGGIIINADALQVFDGWRLLTARPSDADLAQAPHALYGHVPLKGDYSVGHWLRDVAPLLDGARPIIVGGTGLYFTALTEGLVEIPPTPPAVRLRADALPLPALLAQIDAATRARIDTANRMRVQRAWEVLETTGRSLSDWQDATPPPLLPLQSTLPLLIEAPRDWLTPRIERRFDQMLDAGVLDEAAAIRPQWDPADRSARAIGAAELIAHLNGDIPLTQARTAAIIATRQYAKRQRTWFSARMKAWHRLNAAETDLSTAVAALIR